MTAYNSYKPEELYVAYASVQNGEVEQIVRRCGRNTPPAPWHSFDTKGGGPAVAGPPLNGSGCEGLARALGHRGDRPAVDEAACLGEAGRVRGRAEDDRDDVARARRHPRRQAVARLVDIARLASAHVEDAVAAQAVRVDQVMVALGAAERVVGQRGDVLDERLVAGGLEDLGVLGRRRHVLLGEAGELDEARVA